MGTLIKSHTLQKEKGKKKKAALVVCACVLHPVTLVVGGVLTDACYPRLCNNTKLCFFLKIVDVFVQ